MERRGLGALLLRRAENFAWYTGGGNSRVDYTAPEGVADVVVTQTAEYVLTSTIETARTRDEQVHGMEVVEYPWHEGPDAALRDLVGSAEIGADVALPGAADIRDDVSALRRVLDPDAIARLRAIGADLGAALAEAAAELSPGMSEHDAAAAIAASCRARALVPAVLLAATDERIRRYRHPLPTDAPLARRAMLVASAQRGGLYANLTRFAWFEEPDRETERRQAACDEILRRMRVEATRPGRTLADAFGDCRRFYADAGFADEWRLHHQGGITGYASRELIATPHTDTPIETGQAFAWNPSITGAKAEETFVLTGDGAQVVAGTSQNVEVVRAIYSALAAADRATLLSHLDLSIRVYDRPVHPEVSLYEGHEGFVRFAETDWDSFDEVIYEPQEFVEREPYVIVPIRQRGTGKGSSLAVEESIVNVWKLLAGKCVELRNYSTIDEALAAVAASASTIP
jgi:Xaa-Pro dipeptidase